MKEQTETPKVYRLSPEKYNELTAAMAKLAIAVRIFPSDIILGAVRSIGKTCLENSQKPEPDVEVTKICIDTEEKRALLDATGTALVAAKIHIDNAMNVYRDAAQMFEGDKAQKSGLLVPVQAGRITLTDAE